MKSIGDEHSTTRRKKGQWTAEEDLLLMKYIETHGEGKWGTVPQKAGLQRCAKGCRLRWRNYLRPNLKRGNISLEEEDLIIRLHKLLGNRWSLIAGRVPGRTDTEIKNYWNSRLSKKLRCNVILETPSHYKASSSPLDHLHLHSYEKDLIESEILYGYSSLPDCKMDYLDSQQHSHEGDHLKSSHFSISHITNDQINRASYTAKKDSNTRSSQCQSADCNGRNSSSQVLSASHDVALSTEASLQQQPPPGHLCERNGHVFHSMAVMQPKYYPSPSLCVDGGIVRHDKIWDCNDLGCTDMQDPPQLASYDALLSTFCEDPITTGFGDFGGDVQSINSILDWDNIHANFNTIEENPFHDLYTF